MKVLIATDGSEFSVAAIETVCEMLVDRVDPVELKIVSVCDLAIVGTELPVGLPAYYQELADQAKKDAETIAENSWNAIQQKLPIGIDVSTEVRMGNPPQVIIEIAERWNADLIVVGSHGRGFWNRSLLGSVSDAVVHHAKCSVLVVRKPDPG
jgi:nucleotide-binding universal stress UspA family protein